MTLREALTEAAASIDRRDAETLLAHLLFRDRPWLIAHSDTELSSTLLRSYRALVSRRAAKEPIQYLIGHQEFYGLMLRVTRDTLIPRPETELLVEAVLRWVAARPASPPPRILDIGTGTGAIALALASKLPLAHITASDLYPAALAIAEHNAARHHLVHRVTFLQSDLLAAPQLQSAPPFDVIVSNPPYVSLYEAATMSDEVLKHEPHSALFAGVEGLDIYRRLLPAAHAALKPEGLLALEFGFGQLDALRTLFEKPTNGPWQDLQFLNDYAQIPRIALATRP
ncbi:MAG TPA: peptide chain release factor N(5)-glutamine methyltransferase [Acidobacteriaceae bacterium]|nr:peptide chain release factor N(5)-glutamine methyltransferase [Acidobacteriaceae bacterium]